MARKHGYASNPAVNAFMREVRNGKVGHHGHTLCYISSLEDDGRPRRQRHWNEAELIRGIQDEAMALGCDLDIIDWSLELADQVRLSQIIKARGIQGIFLGPATSPHTKMNLNWDTVAVISSGFTFEEPPMHRTAADLFTALFDAGQRAMMRNYDYLFIAMQDASNERVGWRWLSASAALRELYGKDRVHVLRGSNEEMSALNCDLL